MGRPLHQRAIRDSRPSERAQRQPGAVALAIGASIDYAAKTRELAAATVPIVKSKGAVDAAALQAPNKRVPQRDGPFSSGQAGWLTPLCSTDSTSASAGWRTGRAG